MSGKCSRRAGFGAVATGAALLFVGACAAHGEDDTTGFEQTSPVDGGADASDTGGSGGVGGSGGSTSEGGSGGETGGSGGSTSEGGSGGSGATGGSGGATGGAGGTGGATGGTGGSTGGTGGSTGGTGGSTGGTGGSTGGTGGATGGTGGATGGTGGATGGTGGSTGGTGGATGGTGGSTGGTAGTCMDNDDEPNDTEDEPQVLDSINDCDGNGDTVSGTLEGGGDKDWFTFYGDDDFGCSVNPTFTYQSSASALMCAYFVCVNGGDNINCPNGSSVDTSPGGLSGCCTTTGDMEVDLGCSGTDDSAQVYFLVYAPSNTTCQSYTVSYHY